MVTLIMYSKDGIKTSFRIQRTAPLKVLLNAYASNEATEARFWRFIVDGRKLNELGEERTADMLELADNDEILVFEPQCGD